MSVIEAVSIVIDELSNIRIPAALIGDIGLPVSRSIHNLNEIKRALENPVDIQGENGSTENPEAEGTEG